MRATYAAWAGLAMLLAGCVVGPDYRAPRAVTAVGRLASPFIETESPTFTTDPPPGAWWRLYDAPELDALVDKALVHNTDLRVALTSLEAAQADLRAIEDQRAEQTRLAGGVAYGQASADAKGAPEALQPGPVYAAAFGIDYDLDLFGRIRRGVEAGADDVEARRAALDLTRVNVAAAVVEAYATVCSAGKEIAVADRSVALARHIEWVTQQRFQGGVAGANDVVRSHAVVLQTQAQLPTLLARRRGALFLLTTLTGDPPEAFPASVAACAAPPVIRRPLPVGDGMSLLKRRPDVREAERRLAASVAEIGVVTSALYPSVTLNGQIGTTATQARDIVRDRGFAWSLGPLVSWNIPNRTAARAEVARANAVARGRLAAFDGVVLTALRETEVAIGSLARQMDTEQALREARDQAAIAARNTERLYAGGIGGFIDTLDAERTLIQADAALAEATSQLADHQVRLFLALGGGWEEAPMPLETPLDDVTLPHPHPRRVFADPSPHG